MACNCGCNQNRGFEEVVRAAEERRSGCSCSENARTYNDFTEIFEREARDLGPYTWNGYVWYDMEVEFTGPYFRGYRREYNGRNGRSRSNGCGCGCNN